MTDNRKLIALALFCTPLLLNAAEETAAEAATEQTENVIDVSKHKPAPPPPPGPYMSTALTDNQEFVGGHNLDEPASGGSPFFTPDMPWPDHRMPRKWMPDDGYRFAPPGMSEDMQRSAKAVANTGRAQMPARMRPPMMRPPMQRERPHAMPQRPAPVQRQQRPPRQPQAQRPMQRPQPVQRPGNRRPAPANMPANMQQQGKQHDARGRGNSARRPHMMDRRAMPPRNAQRPMPPPPQGPWLPLDRYPRW